MAPSKLVRSSRWRWVGAAGLGLLAIVAVGIVIAVKRAEPILRARIVSTLTARFHGPVELAELHVSVAQGLQVSGKGLNIFGPDDPDPQKPGIQPLIGVSEFRFNARIADLFRSPMRVQRVYLRGLELNIPPKEQRPRTNILKGKRITIEVNDFECDQARLIINTLRPDKLPLEFAISNLRMTDIGPGQPLRFAATLINPKPIGEIHAIGFFGPWQPDEARTTPVRGDYSFSAADLGTIKGIGGILSSTGNYHGTLEKIEVYGKTETPDFRITISNHPVPLHTDFHAVIDGTSGDTFLEPVKAKLLNSVFIVEGSVVRVKNPNGHRIILDVHSEGARIEDLLKVAVRTDPPVMTGATMFNGKMELAPGEADVTDRLRLAGDFQISGARFTSERLQSRLDALSERTRGRPKQAKEGIAEDIRSQMDGVFTLRDGLLAFSRLHFEMPGTKIAMTGKYSLDGREFDFHGTARLDAKLSQMVTGWKSILLKPLDPFLSKHGGGSQIPIKVTGTNSEPHFGLDFGYKGKTPDQARKGTHDET
jgi:hypothetical protein